MVVCSKLDLRNVAFFGKSAFCKDEFVFITICMKVKNFRLFRVGCLWKNSICMCNQKQSIQHLANYFLGR